MRRNLFALAACLTLPAAAFETRSDAELLEGNWVMVSLTINGEPAPEEQVTAARLVVAGNRYSPHFEDRDITETIKLDPSKTPHAIDFTYTEGPRKGEKVQGIYSLDGDRYTMCRPLQADEPRPTQFASPEGSGLVLVVWDRDTPAERARRKAIADERKAMEGTWAGELNLRDGQPISADEVKNARLIITRDRYTLDRGRDNTSRGFTRLDPTKNPKTMDISIIDGPNEGQTWLGIYELSGDIYRSCFATEGKPRPSAFSSEPGSGNILWVFKRETN